MGPLAAAVLVGVRIQTQPRESEPHWEAVPPTGSAPSWCSLRPPALSHSGRKNSRTMLLPLLQRFPEQVRVSLFHTPNLRGLLRLLIPERFNETIGLQHIKVYLFDNNVILSG